VRVARSLVPLSYFRTTIQTDYLSFADAGFLAN